jgi:hypothetical protein
MRSILRALALKSPPINELYEEQNSLRREVRRLWITAGKRDVPTGPPPEHGSLTSPRLHLGCGPVKLEGWCNVDILPTSAADVVDDIGKLERFQSESADEIRAVPMLEGR